MLQFMRERAQGWLAWLIVIVICLVFVLWGAEDIMRSTRHSDTEVARIDGHVVDASEVDIVVERIARQQNLDESNYSLLRAQVKPQVVERRAILMDAQDRGYTISDKVVLDTIMSLPDFAEEGRFSPSRYQQMISASLYSDSSFRDAIYQDLVIGQLQSGIVQSSFLLPSEESKLIKLLAQRRKVSVVTMDPKTMLDKVSVSEEEIKEYYEAHKSELMSPERVSVEYVELKPEDLESKISITDESLQSYYEEHKRQYNNAPSVKIAHILVSKQTKDGKAVAQGLYDKIKAGATFESVASESSADTLSAKKGGVLEDPLYEKDKMNSFEQAAFDLKKVGDISLPVETNYGWHIIQLKNRTTPAQKSFAEVKSRVKEDYKRFKTEELYDALANKMITQAFESSDSLEAVVAETGLKTASSALFSAKGGTGIFSNPKVVQAAFSDEVKVAKNNSELIEIAKNHAVVLRMSAHEPAAPRELNSVAPELSSMLKLAKAANLMRTNIDEQLQNQSTKKPVWQSPWKTMELTRQSSEKQGLIRLVFSIPRQDIGRQVSFFIDNQFMIVRLDGVAQDKLDEAQEKLYKLALARSMGDYEFQFYLVKLRDKIVYKAPKVVEQENS